MAILRLKNADGSWVDVPEIHGENAYEGAVRNGFTGTEAEFYDQLSHFTTYANQAKDAADRAEEVMDSIPQDYQTLDQHVVDLTEHIVEVSETQPVNEQNKLWIQPTSEEVRVPTYEEFEELRDSVAPIEENSTFSKGYSKGESFIHDGGLCVTTVDVAQGDTITVGTNCSVVPDGVAGEVDDLKSAINDINVEVKKIGEIDTLSGGSGYDSVYYPVKAGQAYLIDIQSGELRIGTRNSPDGETLEWLIGTATSTSRVTSPYRVVVTPTLDASYLRIAADSAYEFTVTYADSLVQKITDEIGSYTTFDNVSGYGSHNFNFKAGTEYLISLTRGYGRLFTYSNGAAVDDIIGTRTRAPFETVFTATANADYIRIAADEAMTLSIIETASLNGKIDLQGYNSRNIFAQDVYSPYPQLPADGSSGSDFNAETVNVSNIYAYLDNLVEKYPQVLTKTTLGKDATNTFDVNRYVFADSTKSSFLATVLIWANEHGPTSDPREPAIVACRFLNDLCKANAKTNPYLNYLKKNFRFVVIPVLNPYGFDNSTRNNGNNVNINRNYPTPGWSTVTDSDKGSSAGSEVETQYVISTIDEYSPNVAIDVHCLGYVNENNDNKCHYSGVVKNQNLLQNVINEMLRDYGLICTSYGTGNYNSDSTGAAYLSYRGIDGMLIELNAREGVTSDDTLHTSTILEADYTFMLRIMNMLLWCYDNKLLWT